MKKIIKRIMALSLCMCMLIGTSVVASAASGSVTHVPMLNKSGDYGYMNVQGTATLPKLNDNVWIYKKDNSNSMLWRFDGTVGGDRVIKSMMDPNYCLNPDRRSGQNWNAIVYTYNNNEYDSLMLCEPYAATDSAPDVHYGETIRLKNWANFYLKSDGYTNGSNVHFVYITPQNVNAQWTNYLWDVYYI